MMIGMMGSFSKPTQLAKITSLICKNYNIELVYMRPKDVNIEKETINGKVFVNNKWEEKEVSVPPFIDISPYNFKKKNKEITDFLKEKSFLSDDRTNVLKKRILQERLREDPEYSHLVIPTFRVKQFEDLKYYLGKLTKVVLKPSGGIQGQYIYVLEKKDNAYILGYKTDEKYVEESELKEFYSTKIARKGYIIQKHISSRTKQGDPFDCRVHVEKNGEGEWQSAKNYIRIGIGQKVISNVNQGGGIADPKQFLKANYGDKWREINDKLNNLAVTLPYKYEEWRGTHVMSLGIDVGIGEDGELYIFEINDLAATSTIRAEVAYLRSNYYKYVLEKKLKLRDEEVMVDHDEYKKAIQERNFYKKEYNKLKSSTSWRLSSPIRKFGSLTKKLKKK